MQFYGKTLSSVKWINLFIYCHKSDKSHSYTTHSSLTTQATNHRVSKTQKQNLLCGSERPQSCRGTGSACGVAEVMRKDRGLEEAWGRVAALLRNSRGRSLEGFPLPSGKWGGLSLDVYSTLRTVWECSNESWSTNTHHTDASAQTHAWRHV